MNRIDEIRQAVYAQCVMSADDAEYLFDRIAKAGAVIEASKALPTLREDDEGEYECIWCHSLKSDPHRENCRVLRYETALKEYGETP